MKTIDDEVVPEALRFMTDAKESDTPFFVWLNTTHMHFRTHVKDGSRGKAGRWQSEYHDTMVRPRRAGRLGARLPRRERPGRQHDRHVLDRQRSAHEQLAGRRHDAVPQREELQLGGRLPGAGDGALAGPDPARHGAQRDRQPQRLVRDAARRRRRHRRRRPAQGRAPTWPVRRTRCTSTATTSSTTSPAQADDEPAPALLLRLRRRRPDRAALRQLEVRLPRAARARARSSIWLEPYTELRVPKIFNLRTDPYERADITSNTYYDWMLDHAWTLIPAQAYVARMLQTLARVPAPPGAGQLQRRPGAGEAQGRRPEQLTCTVAPARAARSRWAPTTTIRRRRRPTRCGSPPSRSTPPR